MSEPIPGEVRDRHVVNAADARAQASEGGYGFLRSEFRRGKPTPEHPDGEVFEIPHKDLFDADQQDRWDDLVAEIRGYDRQPDVVEPDILHPDGSLMRKGVVHRGALVVPHERNGERVRPSWSQRLGIVLWGEDGAARARAAGINFNEIDMIWDKQAQAMEAKRRRDSKSAAGDSGLASAPDRD